MHRTNTLLYLSQGHVNLLSQKAFAENVEWFVVRSKVGVLKEKDAGCLTITTVYLVEKIQVLI